MYYISDEISIYMYKYIGVYVTDVKRKKRVIFDINPDIHKEFKMLCEKNNQTISDVMRDYIEEYIKKYKKNIVY